MPSVKSVLAELRALGSAEAVRGMARFGIRSEKVYGVSAPDFHRLAKRIGRDHGLALGLWNTGVHDARILAALIADPGQVTEAQMDAWVADFDNWAVCDNCCGHLFDKTEWAYAKAVEWSAREEEYVKRAGFVMMAELAVHDKAAPDARFLGFLPIIRRGATDERNFVKKAVNWALRQIGKRSPALNKRAIAAARAIQKLDSAAARWVAADALRELTSEAVQKRFQRKHSRP
jgi:3-methyladenine DNA glycosylase AlkD